MIAITGQTATGKTKLAFDYVLKKNGEIINFDSRQVYKNLDIVTGKDLPKKSQFYLFKKVNSFEIGYHLISYQNQLIKLWLYDICYPNQYFSSFNFSQLAKIVITETKKNQKLPILVGGSYFYLKHFLYDFDYQAPPNFKFRQILNQKNILELQKILIGLKKDIKKDFNQSDWQNPRRLIRRIEILTYQKKEKLKNKEKNNLPDFKIIGLVFKDKEKLKEKIKDRVYQRLKNGAIDEVKKLISLGYKKTDPGLITIGYKQIIGFLEGKISKEKMIENWINAETQYAQRQYVFMKKDKNINWREI